MSPGEFESLQEVLAASREGLISVETLEAWLRRAETDAERRAISEEIARRVSLLSDGPPTVHATPVPPVVDVPSTMPPDGPHHPSGVEVASLGGDPRTRYECLRLLAVGGMGRVYLARDRELKRLVALKDLRPELADSQAMRARFVREIGITAQLDHPGIVPIYGHGTEIDGRPFFVMRFVSGESLSKAAAAFHQKRSNVVDSTAFFSRYLGMFGFGNSNRLSPHSFSGTLFRSLIFHLLQACWAVAYAHQKGVIHRDLKPANILIGRFGETCLLDWGLAKLNGDFSSTISDELLVPVELQEDTLEQTNAGTPVGTIAYASPEQLTDAKAVGAAADIYSLGASLYHLLTDRPPFVGNASEVLSEARRAIFPAPRTLNKSVPPTLESICLKAMSLPVEERFSTVDSFAEALKSWLSATA